MIYVFVCALDAECTDAGMSQLRRYKVPLWTVCGWLCYSQATWLANVFCSGKDAGNATGTCRAAVQSRYDADAGVELRSCAWYNCKYLVS